MRRLVGTGAIALIVGLAGCSGGGDKPAEALPPTATSSSDLGTVVPPPSSSSASPTVTPTSSTSPSAQPTKPTLPAIARQHSRAGAKAMAKYWLHAWDLATNTGNTKPMWSVSRSSCKTCANFGDEADAVIRQGGTITPVHHVRLLAEQVTAFSSSVADVRMSFLSGQAHIRIPKTHQDIIGEAPSHAVSTIRMSWVRTHWLIDDMYRSGK